MTENHEANRAFWDRSAGWWKENEDKRGLWKKCHKVPTLVLSPAEMSFLKGIEGKTVCVLGSGDNEVAFALAGMGGKVTSVDISERRLQIAQERADALGLKLTFLRADVTDLSDLKDNAFDLAYTGGHMSVWISDIWKYYAEAVRTLKPGGAYIVNEYHPIRRMWIDAEGPEPRYSYFDRGPHKYRSDEGTPTFEYHWTVADHIQAVLEAGCSLLKVDESGEKVDDAFFMKINLDKLPASLLIVGRKNAPGKATE